MDMELSAVRVENKQLKQEIERLTADKKQLLEEVRNQHAAIESADAEMSGSPGVDFMTRQNASLNEANRGVRKVINKALRRQTRGSIVAASLELAEQLNVTERALWLAADRVRALRADYTNDTETTAEIVAELIEEALTQ